MLSDNATCTNLICWNLLEWQTSGIHEWYIFGSFFYWFVKYLCSVPVWLWFCLSRPLVLSYFSFMDFKAISLAVCICRIYFTSELNSLWGCSILDSSLLLTCGPSRIPTWILTWFRGFSLLYGAWIPTFVSTDTRGCHNLYSTFFSAFSLYFSGGKQHQTFQVSGPPLSLAFPPHIITDCLPQCCFTILSPYYLVPSVVRNLPMQKIQVQSLGWEDPLGKEMATHCNILAWRIPWTEEPGGLQSTGLQRVGHNWASKQQQKYFVQDV